MSLNRLKETLLRPCSASGESLSSGSVTVGTSVPLSSRSWDPSTENRPLRKPPKTSLSQQLQRLDYPPFQSTVNPSIAGEDADGGRLGQQGRGRSEKGGDEEIEGEDYEFAARHTCEREILQPFNSGAKGPFEPLLLSSPGESPVFQVIFQGSSFYCPFYCFLWASRLGHGQCAGWVYAGFWEMDADVCRRVAGYLNEAFKNWVSSSMNNSGHQDFSLISLCSCCSSFPIKWKHGRLLEHQRMGVKFLFGLYKNNHGGVLGDDMGLGKTIQTIAFLAAVLGKDNEKSASPTDDKGPILIICPSSVLHNWEKEFSEWGNFKVAVYHGPNRDMILEKLAVHLVEIVLTSFDTFRIQDKILSGINWEIVVIDEAHRLKNEKSGLYKACLGIKTRRRYGLTGTIMQNKIQELFNLFNWFSPGSLGTREHFRDFYDEPLKHGQRLSAPERFIQIAEKRKQHLATVLQKYLLRRTKEETIGHLMLGKQDNVVFCAMSDLQKRVYRRMLELPEIQCLVNKDLPCGCGSNLIQVECCNRIVPNGIIWSYLHKENPEGCDSCPFCLVLPCLIKLQQISNHLELIKPNPKDEVEKQKKDAELVSAIFGTDVDLVGGSVQIESFLGLSEAEHCGKMRALEKLMFHWTSHGDKILLFSYSVRWLTQQ
ncbi:hypothetical protein HPP92_010208 [Vanilla planifolia]|uniref:Helicase ATP-binding domain-containing protein n=1 Tax=Vanilla planifolia TaxID=51239 RepID=A0A835V0K7_VANPL|nr:hypothetical protein HPP92_010208 [Vanilla planifolia]